MTMPGKAVRKTRVVQATANLREQLLLYWFARRGWQAFEFQRQAWSAFLKGESGLIHSATGTGKSYAALGGPLTEWVNQHPDQSHWPKTKPPGLTLLWITPLRALAADTEESLRLPIEELGIPWTVARRTGDTSSSQRQKQKTHLPSLLITTPESLSLQLSYADAPEKFRHLQAIVVDEWHELIGSKRGTMTELCLARLRSWQPALRIWGLSATIGNLGVAMECLLGNSENLVQYGEREQSESDSIVYPETSRSLTPPIPYQQGRLIEGNLPKRYRIESLIPEAIERFPWAGHIGLKMLPQVIEAIEQANSTLVFTNVRSQCEIWYQALLEARPDWSGEVAIHHGSLDREVREWVENALRKGKLLAVVCTSSLDLGVDFSPVDQVIQVGSPKGVARMLQRAGRSGHQPGSISRLLCSPTNAFELIEFAATRRSIEKALVVPPEGGKGYQKTIPPEGGTTNMIESRIPVSKPLDLLVQHLVTIGVGTGFAPDAMRNEIRSTFAYRNLTDEEWQWALDFLTHGGKTLQAYDQYRKLVLVDGVYRVTDQTIAKRHRMTIGTITSDASLRVKYLNGEALGSVEESFVARLKKGDTFTFAGRTLEFIRLRDMTVQVRRAKNSKAAIPRWMGGRIPLSSELAEAMLEVLTEYRAGIQADPEVRALAPILEIQDRWSKVPTAGELVIERLTTREGHHLFLYPFAGRLANDGLAAVVALRLSRSQPITFTTAANDYGCELLSDQPLENELDESLVRRLLSADHLDEDIAASLNSVEMARRQFREIARVAGLVFQGYPGQGKTNKQLQASSGLLYDVFARFEPDSLLLKQAHREVLSNQLDQHRLRATLARLQQSRIVINQVARPTPFSFPLLVDRLREKLSSEKLADRIRRMQVALEKEVEKEARAR